jgi:hypothetical protein
MEIARLYGAIGRNLADFSPHVGPKEAAEESFCFWKIRKHLALFPFGSLGRELETLHSSRFDPVAVNLCRIRSITIPLF